MPFLGAFLPYSVFVNLEVGINSLMIRKSRSFSSTSYFLQLMLERKLGVRINCKANFKRSKQKHSKNTHTHIYIVKYNTQFYFGISRGNHGVQHTWSSGAEAERYTQVYQVLPVYFQVIHSISTTNSTTLLVRTHTMQSQTKAKKFSASYGKKTKELF